MGNGVFDSGRRLVRRRRWAIAVLCVAVAAMTFGAAQAAGAASNLIVYNLYATDGHIGLADGTALYNYGFVGGRAGQPLTFQNSVTPLGTMDPVSGSYLPDPITGLPAFTSNGNSVIPAGPPTPTGGAITPAEQALKGHAQFPAPMIYCRVGDVVQIRLKNLGVVDPASAPDDPHSIHLHGLDVPAANDGVPETSVGAVSAGDPGPGRGNVVVYMFSPKQAGSYFYHCHQEANIHVQMGMYGALVVYNRTDPAADFGPGTGHGGTLHGWTYDKDYVLMETEIDTRQHGAEEFGVTANPPLTYNSVTYKPQFWFLNGLSFPQTIHAGFLGGYSWAEWSAAHPGYDPLVQGSASKAHPGTAIPKGDKVLLRMVNMGFETQPMHMHGFHGKVIGSDQRAWPWANRGNTTAWGQGMEKNTLTIGSGEAYDWLVNFGLQAFSSKYSPDTQTRYDPATGDPVSNTQVGNPVIPDTAAGADYIGGPVVTGAVGLPTPGQLFPFHNHDDYKATNNGAYPGGMFTMLEMLP